MRDEHTLLLGEIKGKIDLVIDGQAAVKRDINGMDARLRKVERKAAINGGIAGGVIGIGVAIAIEKIKLITGMGG